MKFTRRGSEVLADRLDSGWVVDAEHEWIATGSPDVLDELCARLGSAAQRIAPSVALLGFGNGVGRYALGDLGWLDVRSGKWTEGHYTAMLADIATWSASLPFHAGAPSALPYSRSEVEAPDVLYHSFVWLRHALLEREDAPLAGALLAILADPHRRMVTEERLVAAELVSRVSQRALDEVAAGLRPLRRVPAGRGIGGGSFFPIEMAEEVARPTVNTAENRFVKAFLESCGFVVEAMRQRMHSVGSSLGARVRSDCAAIDGLLAPIQRHRVWQEVGPMTLFPASSTVLQRRGAYREVLRHHILMRMASKALPLDEAEVSQLLEVKNIAKLYELWSAFAVIDAVRELKGAPPDHAERVRHDGLSATIGGGLLAKWEDGTEVAYDAPFTAKPGFHGSSWSLRLRPDVAIWVPFGREAGLHFMDAKFKLEGSIVDSADDDTSFKSGDVHKMHTYRDAIAAARSAWVLYPGSDSAAYFEDGRKGLASIGGGRVSGVGAIPLRPGTKSEELRRVLSALFQRAAETSRHADGGSTVAYQP